MSFVMARKFVSPEPGSDYVPGGRPLTGWKVLAIFVGLFAIVGAVNAVMIFAAVKTFRGEVVQHPYERGLAYNHDIAQARAQDARDWRVDVSIKRGAAGDVGVVVLAKEPGGAPVTGVEMAATFVAPADLEKDASARLNETAVGRYEGRLALPAGIRDLVVTATRAGHEVYRSNNRVTIE
jgi:nitrogen fixation protein FixH